MLVSIVVVSIGYYELQQESPNVAHASDCASAQNLLIGDTVFNVLKERTAALGHARHTVLKGLQILKVTGEEDGAFGLRYAVCLCARECWPLGI